MAVDLCLMEPREECRDPDTPPSCGRSRGGRRIVWGSCLALMISGGIATVLFSLQTRAIFPGSETQGKPSAVVHPRSDEQLVTLTTARGDRVVALFSPALTPDGTPDPKAAAAPTLLYFYGNAMCLNDTPELTDRFRRLGLNVLVPEYVGYGMSGGKPSEAGCQATADAAHEHLRKRKDVDPKKIIAAGWSLGGAVAIDLASRKPVAGLVALSTFTSMTEIARRAMPFLPTSLLLRHRFDNLTKIARVSCPILLGHGRRDDIIPYSMLDQLASAARAPVMKFTIDDAGHNDFYVVGEQQILRSLKQFVTLLRPVE